MKKILFCLLFVMLSIGAVFVGTRAKAADIDSTPDCDNVSVIYCGVSSTSDAKAKCKANKTGDIDNIYKAFGFNCDDISGMINGVVWRNGNVTIGNDSGKNVVATNAMTTGRNYGGTHISGSNNAGKYSTSKFANAGQTALLKFDSNGKFLFAIVKPCGNPVTAKPVTPKIACEDLVVTPIDRNKFRFTAKASASNASIVRYQFVTSNNIVDYINTSSTSASVEHNFPTAGNYSAYVKVTFKFKTNGEQKTVQSNDCKVNFTVKPSPTYSCSGLSSQIISRNEYKYTAKANVANGASVEKYIFTYGDGSTQTVTPTAATASASHAYSKPGTYTTSVAITFKADGKSYEIKDAKCSTKVTVAAAPFYACDSLRATSLSRTQFRFDAKASASNATITKYVFSYSNGQSDTVTTGATTASVTRDFTVAGDYTAKVTVYFTVNGTTQQASGTNCATSFKVTSLTPVYTCDGLTAQKLSRTQYSFNAKATANNGAGITGYRFDYGDGSNQTVASTATSSSVSHTYSKPGDYTARVIVLVNVNGQTREVTDDGCIVKVTVDQPPVTPAATCESIKINYLNNTDVTLTGNADVENGATISAYVFTIKDASGNVVKTQTVSSTAVNATTQTFTLAPATYAANVTVKTSLGDKTGTACNDKIVIPAPEKVRVCNPTTGEIIEVNKGEENAYAPVGSPKCQPPVEVCNPTTGKTISVPADEADNYKPVGDIACQPVTTPTTPETPQTPETPSVLPSTGPVGLIVQVLGVTSLTGAIAAYIRSRRTLLG